MAIADTGATTYTIRRKFWTFLGNQFHVFDAQMNPVLFSKQKAFKLKEDIRVYQDESMTQERLLIKARNAIDFSAAYDVIDPVENKKIGALRRKGFSSIARDSWEFLDENDNPVAALKEDSMLLALIRRFLTNLIPQKFEVREGNRVLASYKQHFNPFVLKLDVHIAPEASERIDPRLALAAGILLAAIERRQQ